jgi:hypothetical protein
VPPEKAFPSEFTAAIVAMQVASLQLAAFVVHIVAYDWSDETMAAKVWTLPQQALSAAHWGPGDAQPSVPLPPLLLEEVPPDELEAPPSPPMPRHADSHPVHWSKQVVHEPVQLLSALRQLLSLFTHDSHAEPRAAALDALHAPPPLPELEPEPELLPLPELLPDPPPLAPLDELPPSSPGNPPPPLLLDEHATAASMHPTTVTTSRTFIALLLQRGRSMADRRWHGNGACARFASTRRVSAPPCPARHQTIPSGPYRPGRSRPARALARAQLPGRARPGLGEGSDDLADLEGLAHPDGALGVEPLRQPRGAAADEDEREIG